MSLPLVNTNSRRAGLFFPHAGELRIVLPGSFALEAKCITHTFICRAASSEATGRVVLCDKTGLLVSHLLCCFHIIPLEYIPQVIAHHAARVSAQCVLRLAKGVKIPDTSRG